MPTSTHAPKESKVSKCGAYPWFLRIRNSSGCLWSMLHIWIPGPVGRDSSTASSSGLHGLAFPQRCAGVSRGFCKEPSFASFPPHPAPVLATPTRSFQWVLGRTPKVIPLGRVPQQGPVWSFCGAQSSTGLLNKTQQDR